MIRLYLTLVIIGFALPYYFFISFLLENGFDLGLLFNQLFANDISIFFGFDLIITALVLLVFIYKETHRLQMGHWWVYALATLLVGPSFSMPLFLYIRESKIN